MQKLQEPLLPLASKNTSIQLEFLSSRQATGLFLITYLIFFVALSFPFILRNPKASTETRHFNGNLCNTTTPCTTINESTRTSLWSISLDEEYLLNGHFRVSSILLTKTTLDVHELLYNLFIYETRQTNSLPIIRIQNASILVPTCPLKTYACNLTIPLYSTTQRFAHTSASTYALTIEFFLPAAPTSIAASTIYEVQFDHPEIPATELLIALVLRISLVLSTLLLLIWYLSHFQPSTSDKKNRNRTWMPIQRLIFQFGVVFLLFWLNPAYIGAELYSLHQPKLSQDAVAQEYVAKEIQLFAESWMFSLWLCISGHHPNPQKESNPMAILFGSIYFAVTTTAQSIDSFPHLFSQSRVLFHKLFIIFAFMTNFLLLVWICWIIRIIYHAFKYYESISYFKTRGDQLSCRFILLETILVLIAIVHVYLQEIPVTFNLGLSQGLEVLTNEVILAFRSAHSPAHSIGSMVFLSTYVYILLYTHVPSQKDASASVNRAAKSREFSLGTAALLVELAWQAYYDPIGQPSTGGHGELNVEAYQFELVALLRDELIDTHAIVLKDNTRLVIAFRGSTSRKNWVTNLRAHQESIVIGSRRLARYRSMSCYEQLKNVLSKMPLAQYAFPRVHSGFWKAYDVVRTGLLDTVELLIDEEPHLDIYTTGHSMGGALAILAAYDISANLRATVQMYNFGSPRVGNAAFARNYNRFVPNSHRIAMDGDFVPGIPRFFGMYTHVGQEVAIDQYGNLVVDPSFLERQLRSSSRRRVNVHAMRVYRNSVALCVEKS